MLNEPIDVGAICDPSRYPTPSLNGDAAAVEELIAPAALIPFQAPALYPRVKWVRKLASDGPPARLRKAPPAKSSTPLRVKLGLGKSRVAASKAPGSTRTVQPLKIDKFSTSSL